MTDFTRSQEGPWTNGKHVEKHRSNGPGTKERKMWYLSPEDKKTKGQFSLAFGNMEWDHLNLAYVTKRELDLQGVVCRVNLLGKIGPGVGGHI